MDNSRRNFLKVSAGVGTLASMNLNLGAASMGSDMVKFVPSVCEMCSSRCPIEAKVQGETCVFINGNPKFGSNKTSVCARGGAGVNQLNAPDRLIKPLVRVGARGEGKWRETTYEEAYKIIAENLGKIKEKYGAQSVVFTSKAGESFNNLCSLAYSYGSPNTFSHYSACPVTYDVVLQQMFGTKGVSRDFKSAKYIVNFGHNLFEGINISNTKQLAGFAADESTKLLVLDPRFSVVAAKADEWIPIKPGTDLAFVMALINVWIRDGKYDKKFIDEFTIGFDQIAKDVADVTPQWQEKITGIPAKTIERIADEIYKAAPKVILDYGHKTTTTKAEYMRTKAIMIANAMMGNFEKKGGTGFSKGNAMFNKIIGEDKFPVLANPDANIKSPKIPRMDKTNDGEPYMFSIKKHGILMEIAPTILSEKPYPIKGWFSTRFNHLINVAATDEVIKAMKKLDFIVAVDIHVSDFASYADVILPEATYLERDESVQEKSGSAPGFYMRNKVVEPIGGTKSNYEILRDLARVMKIDQNYTWKDIKEYRMLQTKGNADLLATLIKDGYVTWKVPKLYFMEKSSVSEFTAKFEGAKAHVDENGLMSAMMKFKTPSGKIELFKADVEEKFPGFGGLNTQDIDVFNGHELCLTSGKTPIHTNGHTQNIKILNDMMSESPIWINPKTAAKKGLKDGDKVVLENEFGSDKGKIMLTQGIREDTLFVYHGFGNESKNLKRSYDKGTNDSKLLDPTPGHICGTMVTNVGVDIRKA